MCPRGLAQGVINTAVCWTQVVPLSHFAKMMKGSEQHTGAALDGVPQDMTDPEV
jgi:glutamine synthetase